MRLAVLADNQGALYDSYSTVDSFDSGAAALATALPQMPSLTTLDLSSTAKLSARCGFLLGAFASVVRRQLALSSLACGRTVGCGRRA